MKIVKFGVSVLLLIASFSAFCEWDALGNPLPPVERPTNDMSGDWDPMGNPR